MQGSVSPIGVLLPALSLSLALAAGCKKSAPSAPSSGAASAVPAADDGDGDRRLALSPVRESRPVDAIIAGLQEGARRDPGRIETWISLGQAWVRKAREVAEPGYYKNADACAALALKLDPRSQKAQALRGIVLLSERRFAEAQQLAEGILRTSEFDAVALGLLSDALIEQGRIDRAEEGVQKMLAQAQPGFVLPRLVPALPAR
jgi:cytochrome c-type biogenesis protein CcmH/NrfG